jgi:hypothetical protein
MTLLGVGTTVAVFAWIGLAIGLIVLAVVIWLLNDVLTPLRKTLSDLQSAKTAPMLERGVPGTEQLAATRRLAESVPDPALAYLHKLDLSPRAEAPAQAAPVPSPPEEAEDDSRLPAWKLFNRRMAQ